MDISLITTSNALEGYKIVKHLGVVRGITVRSRSLVGNFAGGLQSLFGADCPFMLSFAKMHARRLIIF
jgi:uncharacterized protein YbjQ (UPF0145 family)